jgi:hypothetical protein
VRPPKKMPPCVACQHSTERGQLAWRSLMFQYVAAIVQYTVWVFRLVAPFPSAPRQFALMMSLVLRCRKKVSEWLLRLLSKPPTCSTPALSRKLRRFVAAQWWGACGEATPPA